MRIRFIDLDTPCPLLNPYFQLKGTECTGIWSEEILSLLEKARPAAGFEALCEGLGGLGVDKEEGRREESARGRGARGRSVKVESYRGLAEVGSLIH